MPHRWLQYTQLNDVDRFDDDPNAPLTRAATAEIPRLDGKRKSAKNRWFRSPQVREVNNRVISSVKHFAGTAPRPTFSCPERQPTTVDRSPKRNARPDDLSGARTLAVPPPYVNYGPASIEQRESGRPVPLPIPTRWRRRRDLFVPTRKEQPLRACRKSNGFALTDLLASSRKRFRQLTLTCSSHEERRKREAAIQRQGRMTSPTLCCGTLDQLEKGRF